MAAILNSAQDFLLFPQIDPRFQQSTYHDHMAGVPGLPNGQYQPPFSDDAYNAALEYSLCSPQYFQPPQQHHDLPKRTNSEIDKRPTPSVWPSPSSQPYDQPSSIVSSASGASAQTTGSSANVSPRAPLAFQLPLDSKWSDSPHGLGIGPDIANNEHNLQDAYSIHAFPHDAALDEQSYQGFVGECDTACSSTFSSQNFRPSAPVIVPSSPGSLSASSSSPLFLSTSPQTEDLTINTILEEANAQSGVTSGELRPKSTNRHISPRACFAGPSNATRGLEGPVSGHLTRDTYPSITSALNIQSPRAKDARSLLYSQRNLSVSYGQEPFLASQNPTFNQSSGRFIAPLEFSYPSLLQQFDPQVSLGTSSPPQPGVVNAFPHLPSQRFYTDSPAISDASSHESHRKGPRPRSSTNSPYLHTHAFQPYPQSRQARRFSITSSHSRNSAESPDSNSFDEDGREKSRCRDCGRPFKDLKAHMLTHQSERPEKCPIATCSYHVKGFARKYDKNRHTLTHYKGTMVCGFCPGSGSASEKSFNRADVFKRHLTSLHGVEQTPPNSRKRGQAPPSTRKAAPQASDATGKCSTCSATFGDAQEFYEHLDDCVLRIVQQEEPSEAINERILRAVNEDERVKESLDRHMLPTDTDANIEDVHTSDGDDVDIEDDESKEETWDAEPQRGGHKNSRSGKGSMMPKRGNPS